MCFVISVASFWSFSLTEAMREHSEEVLSSSPLLVTTSALSRSISDLSVEVSSLSVLFSPSNFAYELNSLLMV